VPLRNPDASTSTLPPLIHSASGSGPRRRLLLLSYHFTPSSSAGAARWERMAVHLHEHGWGLDVVTLDPGELTRPDLTRFDLLPAGTRVYGVAVPRDPAAKLENGLAAIYRRLRRTDRAKREGLSENGAHPPGSLGRAEMESPDAGIQYLRRSYFARREFAKNGRWASRAADVGRALLEPGSSHRAIVTCGPPHMVHEAGRRLASKAGLPHVMDMRDPWSEVERLPEASASRTWLRLASRYERRCVGSARWIVANTEPAADALRARYPAAKDRIIAVMNGFDDEPLPEVAPDDRFLIAYAGTVYLDRDPRPLFRAAARVIRDLELSQSQFGIEFMGTIQKVGGRRLEELATECGIGEFVQAHPPGTRADATRFLAKASMLVNLPQDSKLAIPSKVFEYVRFNAWMLAMEEPGSATARVLAGGADVVEPSDVDGIAGVIRRRYLEHASGIRPSPVPLWDLSRKTQAKRFASALEVLDPEHADGLGFERSAR
jgi:glycosyltransferase involved in cell wall biosynthesis